jgi:Protein of unknown function (DUF3667)
MRANVDTTTLGMERCVSCDASRSGPYCSQCGERALEPEALTLRHFLVHTVVHELLHVDGTLWRTRRLLFVRPGRLSLEYAAGRRRPYINPFRVRLIAIVAHRAKSRGRTYGGDPAVTRESEVSASHRSNWRRTSILSSTGGHANRKLADP